MVPSMTKARPNIICITWHDLGRHLGTYGWKSVDSPCLDALASQGIRFDHAFCTAPLCSPARASLMSGLYPHNHGMMGLVHRNWRIHENVRLLPQYLNEAGYRTLLFGFQHEAPRNQGQMLGYQETWEASRDGTEVSRHFGQWLHDKGRGEKPFFASIGFAQVHREHAHGHSRASDPATVKVPAYLPDIPAVREDLADYEGLICAADAAAGIILDALRETGLADNTIVIFTTDHGSDYPRAKSSLYDPGIETALIVHWPNVVRPGRIQKSLISHVDILPTLLEIAGAPVPAALPGRSFLFLLKEEPGERRTEIFSERTWHATYDPMRCIRTEHYKLIRNFRPGRPLLMPPEFIERIGKKTTEQYFGVPRPEYELYHLHHDPDETHNLIGNPDHAEEEADLKARLQRFLEETHDPILQGNISPPGPHDDAWDWRLENGHWRLYDPKAG